MTWLKDDILAALEIQAVQGEIQKVVGVEIDTRRITSGGMFLAFRGEKVDGHDYLSAAAEKGAVLALVEELQDHDLPQIQVVNMRDALWQLARYARQKHDTATFVGITGSVGKTSTRSLLQKVVSQTKHCYASSGNFNNDLGMPLCLAQMGCVDTPEVAIFELGMSAPNEIAPLSLLLQPDIALVLNVYPVHLANFANIEGIARAKAEIFVGLARNGLAFVPDQGEFQQIFTEAISHFSQKQIFNDPNAEFTIKDEKLYFKNNLIMPNSLGILEGYHDNVLAVAAVCSRLNIATEELVCGLQSWQPEAGRGAIQSLESQNGTVITVIDDSYNASLPSMLACLENLSRQDAPRKIAVLGDMKELGAHSHAMHQKLIAQLNDYHFDAVFVAGEEMLSQRRDIQNLVQAELQAKDLVQPLLSYLKDGDIVAFKASRSVGMDCVISAIKK